MLITKLIELCANNWAWSTLTLLLIGGYWLFLLWYVPRYETVPSQNTEMETSWTTGIGILSLFLAVPTTISFLLGGAALIFWRIVEA